MTISALLFIVFLFGGAHSTIVSKCTNGPLPDDVQIENCDEEPCVFYINSETSMTLKFKSPRKLVNIAPNALANVMGINVTYPLGQDNACDGITNTKCPIEKGQQVEYTYGMTILPIFPEVSLNLEFSLQDKDNNNENVECFKLDIQIKKP
ncbi:NPC intracellular cholesterol transporter 2 homolog a isoform X1 [Tribolium madens]|uniref:NPC intracellular cholesterol transporter 2 homolog a isoform X1 n=1 Tax=Tribolium madens TaxID=41895 RepID=UPI001CF75663|nr:NPC intracellular cholesterol transporter 2 homolog a isoform X1 [Tribolium madens]